MNWTDFIAYAFGGAFLTNAIPHLVSAVTGRPFQSPFATPHGVGLSSSTVNALWGCFNLIVAYALLVQVGDFDLHNLTHAGALGLGILITSVATARLFGRFHGGNTPLDPSNTSGKAP